MSEEVSALRDDIEKKGSNAYYYAHASTANGPEWDGKEEPRLLETTSGRSESFSRPCTSIREYSWGDGNKKVTIYVDFDRANEVETEKVAIETTADTVTFSITDFEGKDYKLFIDKLNAEIESASHTAKESQFRILLKKKDESPWFSLKKG